MVIVILSLLSQTITAQQQTGLRTVPKSYICQRAIHPIQIDGMLNEQDWQKTTWSDHFVDIEGDSNPSPYYDTRIKMLWDDTYLYISAHLKEENLWATYTAHDAVIYHENDFEVFIDPDGDNHNYYELELNALGTVWDLMLTKPYRDQGIALDSWEIPGLKKGIHLDGTLNDPSDRDQAWTIELALPWSVLKEAAAYGSKPQYGDIWRVNFSRVQWEIENKNGTYVKKVDPKTGKHYPENNWVWSPQYAIAMHQPETWGYVRFSSNPAGAEETELVPDEGYEIKLHLIALYLAEHEYKKSVGVFTSKLDQLDIMKPKAINEDLVTICTTPSLFEISYTIKGGKTWHVSHDGKLWATD